MTDIRSPAPSTEQFTPKIWSQLREGYGLGDLKADALAGLTVAIVALPLSMAIAIAAGLPPERGLATAIVGGFVISLLGGSRFQIGGPAGASSFSSPRSRRGTASTGWCSRPSWRAGS